MPVNALFEDDFVTQLVVVRDTDTVDQAARKVAAQVVGRRVPPRDAGLVVRHDGRVAAAMHGGRVRDFRARRRDRRLGRITER